MVNNCLHPPPTFMTIRVNCCEHIKLMPWPLAWLWSEPGLVNYTCCLKRLSVCWGKLTKLTELAVIIALLLIPSTKFSNKNILCLRAAPLFFVVKVQLKRALVFLISVIIAHKGAGCSWAERQAEQVALLLAWKVFSHFVWFPFHFRHK